MRRKGKRQQVQERAEAAEGRRRLLEITANPDVVTPDEDVVRALDEYERAASELERVRGLPEPSPDKPACQKHTGWTPSRPFVGAPLPPASQCPECAEEHAARPVGQHVLVTAGGSLVPTKEPTDAQERSWDRRLGSLENDGVPIPGSDLEASALARIDDLREAATRATSPRVVYANPVTGVVLHETRRARRPVPTQHWGDSPDEIIVRG